MWDLKEGALKRVADVGYSWGRKLRMKGGICGDQRWKMKMVLDLQGKDESVEDMNIIHALCCGLGPFCTMVPSGLPSSIVFESDAFIHCHTRETGTGYMRFNVITESSAVDRYTNINTIRMICGTTAPAPDILGRHTINKELSFGCYLYGELKVLLASKIATTPPSNSTTTTPSSSPPPPPTIPTFPHPSSPSTPSALHPSPPTLSTSGSSPPLPQPSPPAPTTPGSPPAPITPPGSPTLNPPSSSGPPSNPSSGGGGGLPRTPSSPSSSSDELSAGVVIGIAIGGVALLVRRNEEETKKMLTTFLLHHLLVPKPEDLTVDNSNNGGNKTQHHRHRQFMS
ncbi:hypothetical protein DY000_02009932 [Brassica cretica]|uniref:Uncharacterized protein n=1 Tax=Brassica cretica TaxID=69181 RepID=A0ABQ7CD45_BRACR|nr:hypothetical protein DY000_02009932 [Brassica cretica]